LLWLVWTRGDLNNLILRFPLSSVYQDHDDGDRRQNRDPDADPEDADARETARSSDWL